jgi:hypothetical protein
MRRIFDTVLAVLREVFGETAYERYLAEHGLARSPESFAAFLREREGTVPRPRCC